MTKITNRLSTSWAELRLIRVGHHLWARYKRERGKSPQTGQESGLHAAIEDVWRCKRELRAELEARRVAKMRTENGRFVVNVGCPKQHRNRSEELDYTSNALTLDQWSQVLTGGYERTMNQELGRGQARSLPK